MVVSCRLLSSLKDGNTQIRQYNLAVPSIEIYSNEEYLSCGVVAVVVVLTFLSLSIEDDCEKEHGH